MSRQIDRLVILGSTTTALALARQGHAAGFSPVLVDTQRGVASASRCADVRIFEEGGNDEILDALTMIAKEYSSALVADSDSWVRWMMTNRQELDAEFERVLHPDNASLEICLDKTEFLNWCHSNNFDAPQLYDCVNGDPGDAVRYPVLVRPRQTRHGAADTLPKAAQAQNENELRSLLKKFDDSDVPVTVSESLLQRDLRQYSVGLARNGDGVSKIFLAEKVRPPAAMCAGGTYVVSTDSETIAAFARRAASAIKLFGVAELEILQDCNTEEAFLIEINPRPWVQYALTAKCGFDFVTLLLDPSGYDSSKEDINGGRWLSFSDDAYVVFSRSEGMLRNKDIDVVDYLRSVIQANAHATWSWTDIVPVLTVWRNSIASLVKNSFNDLKSFTGRGRR